MSETIKDLELQLEEAKQLVAKRDMAMKLAGNREFRILFLEEFFVTEAARLVQQSSDPSLSAEQRADALSMAQATGHTRRYLSMMVQMAAVAERQIPELEAAIEELRASELADI